MGGRKDKKRIGLKNSKEEVRIAEGVKKNRKGGIDERMRRGTKEDLLFLPSSFLFHHSVSVSESTHSYSSSSYPSLPPLYHLSFAFPHHYYTGVAGTGWFTAPASPVKHYHPQPLYHGNFFLHILLIQPFVCLTWHMLLCCHGA